MRGESTGHAACCENGTVEQAAAQCLRVVTSVTFRGSACSDVQEVLGRRAREGEENRMKSFARTWIVVVLLALPLAPGSVVSAQDA
jgi:hypothetical protein